MESWVNGGLVQSITFITNKGTKSPTYGIATGGAEYSLATFPDGYRVIGLYGKHVGLVSKLGFILGRTVIPGQVQKHHQEDKRTMEINTE